MGRAIDSEVAFCFLTEQKVKETGVFSKGVNKGLNIARSAMRNPDAIPTLPQPSNEALTLEQLREMEQSTPVWWDYIPCWVLVRRGSVLAFGNEPHKVENLLGNFYRRPPEGEEEP